MTESEALERMVAPGTRRPGKYRDGVIQIHVTRACDKTCFNCTQGSNLRGPYQFITVEQFETAVRSLYGYWGVVGVFGGNPAVHPQFVDLCAVLRKHVPFEQRGLWSNNPITPDKARAMRETFNPAVSNLNVHLDVSAYTMFKEHWPESRPFGLIQDSRHSPPYVATRDVLRVQCPRCIGYGRRTPDGRVFVAESDSDFPLLGKCETCGGTGNVYDEGRAWELISSCDINQHWSAMIGVFRGELRAWFCEIAGAQAMLHQGEEDYPDTGLPIGEVTTRGAVESINDPGNNSDVPLITMRRLAWWEYPMSAFADQVRKHCHDCGVPLRGYGELAQSVSPESKEQVSVTHQAIYRPKRLGRRVELVTVPMQLGNPLAKMTDYLGNSKR